MAHVEGSVDQIVDRLNGVDRQLDGIRSEIGSLRTEFNGRLAQVDNCFAQVDGRFAQIDQKFMWLIGINVTSWTTIMIAVSSTANAARRDSKPCEVRCEACRRFAQCCESEPAAVGNRARRSDF